MTRDDQIADLAIKIDGCFSEPPYYAAEKIILEAEHRAEQRVRAEIGRDSERLDWLLSRSYYGIPGFDPKVSGRDPSARKADLIRAIDAAREGMMSKFDTDGTDNIICHHCGYENDDPWESGGGEDQFDETCDRCEKKMHVTRHFTVSYSSEKLGKTHD